MNRPATLEATLPNLSSLSLGELVTTADAVEDEAITDFLEEALEVAVSFLGAHGKPIRDPPAIVYDQYDSGVAYDPLHREMGEVLVVGGPRGVLRGGERVLSERTDFERLSVLTVLCRGLLHSYDVQLAEAGKERRRERTLRQRPVEFDVYGRYDFPAPAVDHGFSTLFDVYVEADVTDRDLREAVIDAWRAWVDEHTAMQGAAYEAVARTVSDRIAAADGTPRERLCHGLAVQEPLLRDGAVDRVVDARRPD